jgi:hypothetical protein
MTGASRGRLQDPTSATSWQRNSNRSIADRLRLPQLWRLPDDSLCSKDALPAACGTGRQPCLCMWRHLLLVPSASCQLPSTGGCRLELVLHAS